MELFRRLVVVVGSVRQSLVTCQAPVFNQSALVPLKPGRALGDPATLGSKVGVFLILFSLLY